MLFSVIRYLVAISVCTTWLFSTAIAAPPADCVKKHAGRWQITVRATGQTYPADLFPNGTGVSHCPGCAPGTWTCSGNTSTVFVNGQTVVSTLSPDGRSATSGCCTSMRIGGAPAVASAAPDKSAPPKAGRAASDQPTGRRDQTSSKQIAEKSSAPAAAVKSAGAKSASCSDITGTSSTAPAASHCKDADRALYAARQIKQSNPKVAAEEFKKAAAAARRAGDSNLELSILREAVDPVAPTAEQQVALTDAIVDGLGKGLPNWVPPPGTGEPGRDFDPKVADPDRFGRPLTQPEAGQNCKVYFGNMLRNFDRNAALCIRDSALLKSLTETDGTTTITRNTSPGLYDLLSRRNLDRVDPRWKTLSGDALEPDCTVPMMVASQHDAFTECARVNLCGRRAAICGLNRASKTDTNCLPISRACLAENPIPQRMAADPAPPPYEPPALRTPLPNPPHRNSTITGPSGPTGGGSSGGVRPAQ